MPHCGMRITLSVLASLGIAALAGCTPVNLPRLLPAQAGPQPAAPSVEDICRDWQRALDGYDAAGERRRLADSLRARGEDPARCEKQNAGRPAVPLSPSVAPPPSQDRRMSARPPTPRERKPPSAQRKRIDATLSCSSELVKGPPDRYKTVCR